MQRKFAILDTNILDYGFKPEYADSVAKFLLSVGAEYDLITTQYSRFELFRGLTSNLIPKAKSLFDAFACVEITGDVFKIAAALSTCYRNDGPTKSRSTGYGDGDTIIGAAGFVHNASIITANLNDFPRPYFSETPATYSISSNKKSYTIRVGVLAPDVTYLNTMITQLYPPAKT